MTYEVAHYIDGKPYVQEFQKTIPIYNPALGRIMGEVGLADEKTVTKAVLSAQKAYPAWAEMPAHKRAKVLFQFRTLMERYQSDLAQLVTGEHGKTLEDAKGSIQRAIEVIEFHCNIVSQLEGTLTHNAAMGVDCQTVRAPLGVCVGISPFNFPVMVPIWLMIPALACGNTFILKPSEQDPSASMRLLELLSEAGLPPGVANCIHGDKTTVEALITHPDVKACTAIASTPVAKAIYQTAIAHGKRAHTFGGAKNHCVLMPDADMKQAAQTLVGAAFGSAGERCMAISVVVVVGAKTAASFLEALIPLTQAITIDAGTNPEADMGPLISKAHKARVLSLVDRGVEEGARLLVDGRSFVHPKNPDGFFLGPCLFDEVTPSMSIYQEEIFGPVLCIVRVSDFEEALAMVNANPYGNGTAIFTRDGYTARTYADRVQVGMVGINIPIPVPIANHTFGGWKASSFGDLALHGRESIAFYTQLKSITTKWPMTQADKSAFIMPTH